VYPIEFSATATMFGRNAPLATKTYVKQPFLNCHSPSHCAIFILGFANHLPIKQVVTIECSYRGHTIFFDHQFQDFHRHASYR
jgi:hypothetical protein